MEKVARSDERKFDDVVPVNVSFKYNVQLIFLRLHVSELGENTGVACINTFFFISIHCHVYNYHNYNKANKKMSVRCNFKRE